RALELRGRAGEEVLDGLELTLRRVRDGGRRRRGRRLLGPADRRQGHDEDDRENAPHAAHHLNLRIRCSLSSYTSMAPEGSSATARGFFSSCAPIVVRSCPVGEKTLTAPSSSATYALRNASTATSAGLRSS